MACALLIGIAGPEDHKAMVLSVFATFVQLMLGRYACSLRF